MLKVISSTILTTLFLTTQALSQGVCGDRQQVVDYLTGDFGETTQMIGLDANGSLVEIWGNVDTGTWTLTLTSPEVPGITCIVVYGGMFNLLPPPPPGELN